MMNRVQARKSPQIPKRYLALASDSTASGSGGTPYCWRYSTCSSICPRAPTVTMVASVFGMLLVLFVDGIA